MSIIHQALSQSNQPTADGRARKFNPLAKGPSNQSTRIWIPIAGTVLLTAAVLLVLLPSDTPSTNSTPVSPDIAAAQITQTATATPAANTDLEIVANTDTDKPTVNAQSPETVSEPISEETQSLLIDSLIEEPVEDTIAEEKPEPAPAEVEQIIAEEPITQTEERTLIIDEPADESAVTESVISELVQNQTQEQPTASSIAVAKPTQAPKTNAESSVQRASVNWRANIERHLAAGEIEKAEQQLKNWIAAAPRDAVPRTWLAKIYVNNGFYNAAEPLLNSVNTTEAKGLLGLVYERTNRPALASVTFEELFRSQPDQGKWLLFWAINAENAGELAKSATLYQNYLKGFALEDANLRTFAENRLRVLQGQ